MRIYKSNKLSEREEKEVRELEEICFKHDNIHKEMYLSNEINFNKEIPCFYLAYENDELIGVLSVFMPMSIEAEIEAFVLPEQRKKGVFTKLINEALDVLRDNDVKNILLVMEPSSNSAKNILEKYKDAKWSHTEYCMEYTNANNGELKLNDNMKIKKLTIDEAEEAKEISALAFDMDKEEQDAFTISVINSSTREGYILYIDDKAVGMYQIEYEKNQGFIYGVALLPEYQGLGYGKIIIKDSIRRGMAKIEKLLLDVDSNNPRAYNMYLKEGFKLVFQVDYYKFSL